MSSSKGGDNEYSDVESTIGRGEKTGDFQITPVTEQTFFEGVNMKNRNRFAWLIAAGLGLATYLVAALTVGSPFAEVAGFAVLLGSVVWFVRNGT